MSETIKAEDVLQGIAVDWTDYIPPGGKDWRKVFLEHIGPGMQELRRRAEETKRAAKSRLRRIAKVQALAAEIKAKADELAAETADLDAAAEDSHDLKGRISGIQDGARGVFNFADALLAVEGHLPTMKAIDEDIKFFDAFDAYISADAELDKLLYAMHCADVRHRTKIFRACLRVLAVVEGNRETLRHSKSMAYRAVEGQIAPIFTSLDEAYAHTSPLLRKLKKDCARIGAAALADF